jgi:hypothetical protein
MREQQRQTRRRRKHVVGGLSHVDVIVGMDQPVFALRAAKNLGRAIGQHLVDVHVVRRAGAGLIHVHDELVGQRALRTSSAA